MTPNFAGKILNHVIYVTKGCCEHESLGKKSGLGFLPNSASKNLNHVISVSSKRCSEHESLDKKGGLGSFEHCEVV